MRVFILKDGIQTEGPSVSTARSAQPGKQTTKPSSIQPPTQKKQTLVEKTGPNQNNTQKISIIPTTTTAYLAPPQLFLPPPLHRPPPLPLHPLFYLLGAFSTLALRHRRLTPPQPHKPSELPPLLLHAHALPAPAQRPPVFRQRVAVRVGVGRALVVVGGEGVEIRGREEVVVE